MANKGKDAEKEREARPIQLCIFDERRGQIEGQEIDKILAFYPPEVTPNEQTALVGLVQAMLAFTSLFSPGVPCEAIHTGKARWITHSCGPGLWMLLVVDRTWHPGPVRDDALRTVLRHLSKLCALIHGPLQRLLDQDNTASLARSLLQGTVADIAARYAQGKPGECGPLHNPLGMGELTPFLPLPRTLFTGLQAFVNGLLVASDGSGPPSVVGCMLLHEQFCLWSTLGGQDTTALYRLATSALLPAVQRATQPSLGQRLTSSFRGRSGGHSDRNLLDRKAWQLLPSGFLVLSPADQAAAGAEAAVEIPHVWLQEGEERCGLLGFCCDDELLLLLLGDRVAPSNQLLSSVAEAARPAMRRLGHGVAEELSANNRWHVAGHRYVFLDDILLAVRASPSSKVATLSRESIALATSLREELEDPTMEGDAEILVRGAHDCWVAGRRTGPRTLLLVMEQNSAADSLLDASELTDAFADKHFPGLLD